MSPSMYPTQCTPNVPLNVPLNSPLRMQEETPQCTPRKTPQCTPQCTPLNVPPIYPSMYPLRMQVETPQWTPQCTPQNAGQDLRKRVLDDGTVIRTCYYMKEQYHLAFRGSTWPINLLRLAPSYPSSIGQDLLLSSL